MDRLKFRARFRDRWLHAYEELGGCSISGETMVVSGWLIDVKLKDLNEVIIEQCTGLKDRTGKLIYEGDEIRAIIRSDSVATRGVIVWDEEMSCYASKNLAGLTPLYNLRGFEVIGNRWETPKLLENS